MARREITILTDDLDGTEGTDIETVLFGFDGASYEADLTPKNRTKLENALTPFLDVARMAVKSDSTAQKARAAARRDYDPKAVRAWAQSNKVDVPERGRIPMGIVEQYREQFKAMDRKAGS